jgi:hypothetical protein
MYPLTDNSAVTARIDHLYDELDRYAVDTDYDSTLDDLTREIAELRHTLLSR